MTSRDAFERKTAGLLGVCIDEVEYWDIHLFGEPREWDHGDWHHAVMGVGLKTSAGPVSVIWTSTFFPYGVEVFCEPMTTFLVLSDGGPESWRVTDHPEWQARTGQPVLAVSLFWERTEIGAGSRGDGRVAGRADAVDVPVALRLDVAAGPVWFVSAVPDQKGGAFVPGDEIMVVFSSQRLLTLGFPADDFTADHRPEAN